MRSRRLGCWHPRRARKNIPAARPGVFLEIMLNDQKIQLSRSARIFSVSSPRRRLSRLTNQVPDLAKIESIGRDNSLRASTRSEQVTKRILIVDDEPNIVAAVEFLLQQSGYEVHVANNGEQALELVEACIPDLVLLDVMMPKKSGYDVCTRIRERADWQHIKIIMLSAKGREAEVNKGLSLGADFYVTKPWSNKDLVAKIDELLGSAVKPGRT